jgi:hypothetical protein
MYLKKKLKHDQDQDLLSYSKNKLGNLQIKIH